MPYAYGRHVTWKADDKRTNLLHTQTMITSSAIERIRYARWLREGLLISAVFAIDLISSPDPPFTKTGMEIPFVVFPALAVITSLSLIMRWKYPFAVFALTWLYAMGVYFVPYWFPFAALVVALYAAARTTTARVALAYLAASLLPFVIRSYDFWSNTIATVTLWMLAVSLMFDWLPPVTAWGFARLNINTEHRAEAKGLEEGEAALRLERLALARELHDIVAHSVSAMILQAAGATTVIGQDDQRVGEALRQIERSGVEAMTELHRLLGLLREVDGGRPDSRPGTNAVPGLDDIDDLVSATRTTGVDVHVERHGDPVPLDAGLSLTAYRVAQEGLTNAMRYAGRGALAELSLRWTAAALVVTVRDRGGLVDLGAENRVPGSGYGLAGLSERVKLVGGRLTCGHTSDGFLLQAELPIGTGFANEVASADVPFAVGDGT
jgi:signal transduction histidine kinase